MPEKQPEGTNLAAGACKIFTRRLRVEKHITLFKNYITKFRLNKSTFVHVKRWS